MTGAQFGAFILGLIVVAIVVAIVVWLLNWLYLRSSKERAFVRTGLGGQKVVMNGGAFVLPIVHEVIPVNMNTLRLEVSRGRDKALITKDRMRVDVVAEFYVRVQAGVEAIAVGRPDPGPAHDGAGDAEGAGRGQVRRRAAHRRRRDDHGGAAREARRVRQARAAAWWPPTCCRTGSSWRRSRSPSSTRPRMEFFNPSNAFDAEGLTRLTEQIERRKKIRNDIEQDTMIQIRNKNLETERQALDIDRELEYARLAQERELEVQRAAQRADVARAARRAGAGGRARADRRARGGGPRPHRLRAGGGGGAHRQGARGAAARDRAAAGDRAGRAAARHRRRRAVEGPVRGAGARPTRPGPRRWPRRSACSPRARPRWPSGASAST